VPVLEEVKPPPPLPTPEQAAEVIAAAEARRAWVEQVMRLSEREWERKERWRARGVRLFAIVIGVAFLLFIAFAITVGIIEGMKPPPPPPTVTN
jgi:hypothetical protein